MFSGVACLFLISSWCVGESVGVVLGLHRVRVGPVTVRAQASAKSS
jgi:hypothetical protein